MSSLGSKIKSREQLSKLIPQLKSRGKRIVFTNGCFDLLHYGHIQYLQAARAKGDYLIVGLNSDSSVRKLKGGNRPLVGERDRARILAALASVDYVTIFKELTPLDLIKIIKPDILVKGADWPKDKIVGASLVKGYGGKILTVKLAAGRSTTNLIRKIAKAFSG